MVALGSRALAAAAAAPARPRAAAPTAAAAPPADGPRAAASRRQVLGGATASLALLGVPGLAAADAASPVASPAPAAAASPDAADAAALTADPARWRSFYERDFMFRHPPELVEVFDPGAAPARPGGRVRETPLKAELVSPDGAARVTVAVLQAALLRQTLLQVTDIAALGPPAEVARLLLPPGARLLAAAAAAVPQPPRDTGTPLGVLRRDPVTLYRFEVALPGAGQHAAMAAGALLGRVFLLAAAAPEGEAWERRAGVLAGVADSFRLLPR